MGNWIHEDFKVPRELKTPSFCLRMLTINDLVKDYDAVMLSRDEIVGVFGPLSDWPQQDMSLEQDLIDLGWHQKEFQNRSSFAYTVMSLDETVCLGCVYIYPVERVDTDAKVILWSRSNSGIDLSLFEIVKDWIKTVWPFQTVVFPGRDSSWENWLQQEKQKL